MPARHDAAVLVGHVEGAENVSRRTRPSRLLKSLVFSFAAGPRIVAAARAGNAPAAAVGARRGVLNESWLSTGAAPSEREERRRACGPETVGNRLARSPSLTESEKRNEER